MQSHLQCCRSKRKRPVPQNGEQTGGTEAMNCNSFNRYHYGSGARRLIIAGGANIHIFMFCLINFFRNPLFSRSVNLNI